MATASKPQTATGAGADPSSEWDEARLKSALDRVQELHVQCNKLRDVIPSLIRPIHSEPSSPETLYADLQLAANNAVANIKNFKTKMRDPKTKETLDRAKESREKDDTGVKAWMASSNPDWIDQPALRSANDIKTENATTNGEQAEELPSESIQQTVENFKKAHPDLDVKLEEAKRSITLSLPSAKLNFSITWDKQPRPTFKAITKGSSRILQNVTQFLRDRPKQDDLHYTLELINCYRDVRNRKCMKCNKLYNYASEYAVVQLGNTIKNEDGSKSIAWKHFHFGCEE